MTIGNNIKRIRTSKGYTQQQLGELCNPKMADSAIRRYENGKANPKLETIMRIARALNVSIDDLNPEYIDMVRDRNDTFNLAKQLEDFIEKLPEMDIAEENKQKNLNEATAVLEKAKNLINIIDVASSRDKETKKGSNETETLKQEIQEAQQEIDDMFLFLFHLLNDIGQDKAIEHMTLLTQIPEYTKDEQEALDSYKTFLKDKDSDYWGRFRSIIEKMENSESRQLKQ